MRCTAATIGPVANATMYSRRSSIVGSAQWRSSRQTSNGRRRAIPSSTRRTPQKSSSPGHARSDSPIADTQPLERQRRRRPALDEASNLVEPAEISDELDERPVRDPRAVREAAARHDAARPLVTLRDLARQPRLPDARRARAMSTTRIGPSAKPRSIWPPNARDLGDPADERRVEPAGVAAALASTSSSRSRDDLAALALRAEPLPRPDRDRVLDERIRRRPDQDAARLRRLLEALRQVDRVTGDEGFSGRRIARDDLSGVDPDPAGQLDPPPLAELVVQPVETSLHLPPGPHGAERVVLVDDRDAEDGHHLVAPEPLHRAAVPPDDLRHRLRVPRHHSPGRLGIGCLAERRRAHRVAEEDRHRLAHLEPRMATLRERRAAGGAEPGVRVVCSPQRSQTATAGV